MHMHCSWLAAALLVLLHLVHASLTARAAEPIDFRCVFSGLRLKTVPSLTAAVQCTELFLDDNELQELPPRAFAGLHRLRWLWLDDNAITTISKDAFAGLEQLQILSLSHNKLKTLPEDALFNLKNLHLLSLQGNALVELPRRLFAANKVLSSIDLSLNKLNPRVFDALSLVERLQVLNATGNAINFVHLNALSRHQLLHTLHLDDNGIATLEASSFAGLSRLRDISVRSNQLQELDPMLFFHIGALDAFDASENPWSPECRRDASRMVQAVDGEPSSTYCAVWHGFAKGVEQAWAESMEQLKAYLLKGMYWVSYALNLILCGLYCASLNHAQVGKFLCVVKTVHVFFLLLAFTSIAIRYMSRRHSQAPL